MGNITSIKENGTVVESYTYDSLNQLKTVTRGSDVWVYTYDNGGNLQTVTKNGVTEKTYTYGSTMWRDLMTKFNGQPLSYDGVGNPLTYRDGMSFTWADGRKLTAITKGTDNISYTYDANGLRASKAVNGTATQYYWLNGILQGQKTGSEYIIFLHDENGTAYGFMLKNGTTREYYYYIFNAQGDVIGILDNHGTQVVKYTYNAWGELLSTTGTKAETIGAKNPIRYRGYYYDVETGFYYVSSRYYDVVIGRFISPDIIDVLTATPLALTDKNLFAYCGNNPVNYCDPTGEVAITTIILIASIAAGVASSGYTAYKSYKYTGEIDWGNTILSGFSTFAFCYTYGMSGYGMYLSYCDYKGYTPVTNVGWNNNSSNYPPNNGFNSTPRNSVLQPGSIIQRVGGNQGKFVAPVNTPTQKLSLPFDKINAPITKYIVSKPIPVQSGTALPWYGQPGGGTQFLLPNSIANLQKNGYLKTFK